MIRGIRAAMLIRAEVLLMAALLLVGATPAATKETPTPDVFQQLDKYEAAARAMNQLAHPRVNDIQTDIRTVGNRIASETVGTPYFKKEARWGCTPAPDATEDQYNASAGDPNKWDGLSNYRRSDLDAAINYRLTFVSQVGQKVDRTLSDYINQTEQARSQIEQLQKQTVYSEAGENNRQQMIYSKMKIASYNYINFCRFNYQLVLSGYVVEILFRLQEMANRSGQATQRSTVPEPLGVSCQVQSQLLDGEAKIAREIFSAEKQEAAVLARKGTNEEWLPFNNQERELREQCGAQMLTDLATMGEKLRQLRDRFFTERAQIKDKMIQWQQACIKQHFYEGEGDAAIAQVYANPVINDANLSVLFFPFALDQFLKESNWGPTPSNNLASTYILPGMTPGICEAWGAHEGARGMSYSAYEGTYIKSTFPDLSVGPLYILEVNNSAPILLDNVASGAGAGERP